MRILALLLTLFLAGCASLVKPPAVALAGVGIESLGLFEQRYVLTLRLTNPNNMDIPLEGLSFDVELNGKPFAKGVSNVGVVIPRLGEAVLEVKASSNLAAFLSQWQDLDKGGKGGSPGLDYRVKGTVQISGRGTVPFDHRGDIAIPKLPGQEDKARPPPGSV